MLMLFAANVYYPKGGLEDLVAVCAERMTDQEVLDTVLRKVERYGEGDKLQVDKIEVNAAYIQNDEIAEQFRWRLLFADTLDDQKLRFASVKADAKDIGPCGLIPMTVVTRVHGDGTSYTDEYPTLDPAGENQPFGA